MARGDGMTARAREANVRRGLASQQAREAARPPRQEIPLADRIAKCPQPVRNHIRELENRASSAEARADALEAQLTEQAGPGDSDTWLEWPGHEDVPDRALPAGALIRFGDATGDSALFEVRWRQPGTWLAAENVPARLRERPALLVSGMAQIEILPLDHEQVLIRETEKEADR